MSTCALWSSPAYAAHLYACYTMTEIFFINKCV